MEADDIISSDDIMVCNNISCHTELDSIKTQISECERKINEGKERYHQLLILNLKKDVVIEELKQKLANSIYENFIDVLSRESISKLRALSNEQKDDSTFVLSIVADLYKDDLFRLQNKSFSGSKKTTSMTPHKVDTIQKLFDERMDFIEKSIPVTLDQKSNVGKHIKSAIENINRKVNRQNQNKSDPMSN